MLCDHYESMEISQKKKRGLNHARALAARNAAASPPREKNRSLILNEKESGTPRGTELRFTSISSAHRGPERRDSGLSKCLCLYLALCHPASLALPRPPPLPRLPAYLPVCSLFPTRYISIRGAANAVPAVRCPGEKSKHKKKKKNGRGEGGTCASSCTIPNPFLPRQKKKKKLISFRGRTK